MADSGKQITTTGRVHTPQRRRAPKASAPAAEVGAHEPERVTLRGLPLERLVEAAVGVSDDPVLAPLALDELEQRLGWEQAVASLTAAGPAGRGLALGRWGDWVGAADVGGGLAPASAAEGASGSATPWAAAEAGARDRVIQLKRRGEARRGASNPLDAEAGPGAPLPDALRTALERRSGIDLGDVRVHYASDAPAALGAAAVAAGDDIYVAPGQEEHLAHEAWHVVQQRQGRVPAASDTFTGQAINRDPGLEREADAAQQALRSPLPVDAPPVPLTAGFQGGEAVAQLKLSLGSVRQDLNTFRAWVRSRKVRDPKAADLDPQVVQTVEGWLKDVEPRTFASWDLAIAQAGGGNVAPVQQVQDQQVQQVQDQQVQQVQQVQDQQVQDQQVQDQQVQQVQDQQVQQVQDQQVQQVQQVQNAPQNVQAGPPPMREESRTRIGFEIEVGGHIDFPKALKPALEGLINKTMTTFTGANGPVLEMLLDDIKDGDPNCKAQVEFRTVPLDFSQINLELGKTIRAAIKDFPAQFWAQAVLDAGTWDPTGACTNAVATLQQGSGMGRLRAPPRLAQHATTSIEMNAFGKLSAEEQRRLLPSGIGAKDKQQLLGKLANLGQGNIDASTRGRNGVGIMAKSPVESLMAADPTLQAPNSRSTTVSVSASPNDKFDLGDMDTVAQDIRDNGSFPTMQGEDGQGFRAVAEKLQPPLKDRVSGELRVLVEHRKGDLPQAVNEALSGKPEKLQVFMETAKKMDKARVPKQN